MENESYEQIEKPITRNFEAIKIELEETLNNHIYRAELIRRTLNEKPKIRRTYAVLILLSPTRVGEVMQKVVGTRRTVYHHLYELINLGLVYKIPVMDLWNRKEKELSKEEIEVIKKFKEWTKTMAPGQIRNFAGKTNYFILTETGREDNITAWTLKLEKELKTK